MRPRPCIRNPQVNGMNRVMRTFPKFAFAIVMAAFVAGCDIIPSGLGLGTGQTLKGKVSGSGLGAKTRIGVMSGSFLPSDLGKADVVTVNADGTWSYAIPAGREIVTAFAFVDANGNNRFDSGETSSYPGNYVVASLVGDSWKVQIKRSGTASDADLARANIELSA